MESDETPSLDSVTFACQLCGGLFQFEVTPDAQSMSEFVECPHCHQETEVETANALAISQTSAIPPIIPAPLPVPVWFGSEQSTIKVSTSCGSQFEIAEVLLYDEQDLQILNSLKAQANELFGGAHSEIGFIGDFGWVVGMATLQNWLLRAGSEVMAKKGMEVLQEIRSKEYQLRLTQNYFPVGRIENVEHPSPNLWRSESPDPKRGFIHSGDDFVTIKDSAGTVMCLRWSEVVQFIYQLNPS